MPRSSKPRRKPAAGGAVSRSNHRTTPRKTDPRQAAPGHDIRPRKMRFGDGRPPRLPGRTGGR